MVSSFYVLRQLFKTAQMHPQKITGVLNDQAWAHNELVEHVEHIAYHLHRLNVVQGQIVYQFVERSLEMIARFYDILYASGVYCTINPTEPSDQLAALSEQLKGEEAKPQQSAQFMSFLNSSNTRIFAQYGMPECNSALGCHLLDVTDTVIPLGYPLPGIHCSVTNEQDEMINSHIGNPSNIGEIHSGGQFYSFQ
ncbi:unnamed protein product [Rotaria sp. Silwood2]|nr:unnamed protein product [Rotaria sp. Silwood2]CAF2971448.1 unnamed protein product [Rotaria sp. Silwood2]CAF3143379.1 unnamed protein product [Rotaria sp. Silwood2]CAF4183216.1 unnamed protein product [Rotaria sp. Silwood2]CAF4226038.1 unnamed protein product [Rotaria sp. Silwood2]